MEDDAVYILSGCRTAIGNFQGQFTNISAPELGAVVIAESIRRSSVDIADVGLVIMGQVLTAGEGQNPARQAAMKAKVPHTVPAYTVNMLCGSGLKAIALAYHAIAQKDYEIVVAGGQENMTRAQHATYIRGKKIGETTLSDTLLTDGLIDAFENVHMGSTAEFLAKEYKVSRQVQDMYAFESQKKVQESLEEGCFKTEIVAITCERTGKVLDTDEFPKPKTTMEGLARLIPSFSPIHGTVTAGNSAGINDAAAAVVLANAEYVFFNKLRPLAKIIAVAEAAVKPLYMGLGPIKAIDKVLTKACWTREKVDLYELNESFAVQNILVIHELEVDEHRVNVAGGALALGHPIGASGARILVTLLHNLQRMSMKRGVAALCVGGGMGVAMAIEMCDPPKFY